MISPAANEEQLLFGCTFLSTVRNQWVGVPVDNATNLAEL